PDLGEAERRVRARDPEVAGERLLEPAGEAVAVDGGDHRLPDLEAPRDAGQPEIVVMAAAPPLGLRRAHGGDQLLQAGPGREPPVAGAGQDCDPGGVVVPEARPD